MDKTVKNEQVMCLIKTFVSGKKLPARDYEYEAIQEFIEIMRGLLSPNK